MAAQDHRLAAPRQRDNQILHLAAADGVEPGSRLVQDNQVRVVDQGLGQTNAALHAFGEFAHGPHSGLAQAHHFEQLLRALLAVALGQAEEVAKEIQRFPGIQIAIEIGFLRQIANARLGRHVPGRMAENFNVALGWVKQPEDEFDGS